MKAILFLLSLAFAFATFSTAVLAETVRLKSRPDGQVRFDVSINGPTRISVVGDRIAKVLQSSSAFEMVNDEGTGDVFLRFAGGGGKVEKESGYIVTESGVTIGFVMTPETGLETQTVLISVTGTGSQARSNAPSGFAVNSTRQQSSGTTQVAADVPKSRTDKLVRFVRAVHAKRIADRSPARLKRGIHTSYRSGSLRARVAVTKAPGGKPPHPKSFYRSKQTVAVWVSDHVRNGKVWIIIVEGRP